MNPARLSSRLRRYVTPIVCIGFVLTAGQRVYAVPPQEQSKLPAPSSEKVQVQVDRVVVDVVVTGKDGQAVKSLTAKDFQIFENGKPKEIRSFEEVDETRMMAPTAEVRPPTVLPESVSSVVASVPAVAEEGPLNVIVLDLNSLTNGFIAPKYGLYDRQRIEVAMAARQEIIKGLRRKPPHAKFAIFVVRSKIEMLQGFTDDTDALIAAMNDPRARALGFLPESAIAANPFQVMSDPDVAAARFTVLRSIEDNGSFRSLGELEARASQRTKVALFLEMARILSGLPGRKNLLWFADPFPSPNVTASDGLRRVMRTLTTANVAVYPIDWRGLLPSPIFDVVINEGPEIKSRPRRVDTMGEPLRTMDYDFRVEEDQKHATMDFVAEQTGGRAFYNTNGIEEAITSAVREGRHYYTLTFAPQPSKGRPEMRSIRVECKGDYRLDYRRDYMSLPEKASWAKSEVDRVKYEAQHGAPMSNGVVFTVAATRAPEAAQQKDLWTMAALQAAPAEAALPEPYLLNFAVQRSAADAEVEFVLVAYDGEGKRLGALQFRANQTQKETAQPQIQQFSRAVALPAGTAFLRVVGTTPNRIGSTELTLARPKK